KLVETVEIAVRGREPDADVDLVVGIVRAVVADQDAVRHELDRVADRRDIRAEARGFGAVDGKPPFDARNRPAIGDIDQARHAIEMRANLRDRLGQELGPPRRYLDLDWLAGRRSRVLLLGLDDDPGDIAGALPDFAQDLRGRPPQLPIDVTELDAADQIFFVLAAEANARARVDRLDLRHAENALLDLPDERIALGDRKIAPCADLDCRLRRLDGREELEPAAERGIRRVYADEKHGAGEEHLAGMLDEPAERGDIAMADGAQAFERVLDEQQALVRVTLEIRTSAIPSRTDQRADGRHENERHQQRAGQRDEQCHRQILHELADDPRPEQQRKEYRERRRGRRCDRPRHALRRAHVRFDAP